MATPLDQVFASGGTEYILSFEFICNQWSAPLRMVDEYEDLVLGLEDGSAALFEGVGVDYTLPQANDSGQQTFTLAIDNVRGEAQRLIDEAVEARERISMIVRQYVGDDLTAPAVRPLRYTVQSAAMAMSAVRIEAGFFDMLGRRFPVWYYTDDKFPGLRYQ